METDLQNLLKDLRLKVSSIIPIVSTDNKANDDPEKKWDKAKKAIIVNDQCEDIELIELLKKPTIQHIRFVSNYDSDDFNPLVHRDDLRKGNKEFNLRLYCPPIIKEDYSINQFKSYFILINGFAEPDLGIHDHFGISLAGQPNNPIPSILLPLPFHFVRGKKFRENASKEIDEYSLNFPDGEINYQKIISVQRIINYLLGVPKCFNHCFYQSISDVFSITDIIQKQKHYFNNFIKSDAEISLLGYSIGGLIAMNTILLDDNRRDKEKKKSIFKSVFLLESGATLDNVKVNDILKRDLRITESLYKYYIEDKNEFYGFERFFARDTELNKHKSFDKYFVVKSPDSDGNAYTLSPDKDELNLHISENEDIKHIKKDIYNLISKTDLTTDGQKNKKEEDLKTLQKRLTSLENRLKKQKFHEIFERRIDESNNVWFVMLEQLIDHMNKPEYGDEFKNPEDRELLVTGFYGIKPYRKKKLLRKISDQILIIVGGQDNIFPLSQIINNAPEEGLAILLVPNITHFIKTKTSTTEWLKWRNFLINTITNFNKHVIKNG